MSSNNINNNNNNNNNSNILTNINKNILLRSLNRSSTMSSQSSMSVSQSGSTSTTPSGTSSGQKILLQGYLRKLKTMKKKYFVVYSDAPNKPGTARLEYYDGEKKFRQLMQKSNENCSINPKRSIILRSCFNINRRTDIKNKFIIGLYKKDDCFSIVLESEEELNLWLKTLLILQRGEEFTDGAQPRPTFEHVWDVQVIRKGLGESYGILGSYRLCITDTTLSLVRIGSPTTPSGEHRVEIVEFALASMRRCGATHGYFYLEVGRVTKTGAGEIWMETGDPVIAENMNTIILGTAARRNRDDNLPPLMRIRSQSANESSKPISMLQQRRPTHTGAKSNNFSPSENQQVSLSQSDSSSSATSTNSVVTAPNQNQNYKLQNNQMSAKSLKCQIQSTEPLTTVTSNATTFSKFNNCQSSYTNLIRSQDFQTQSTSQSSQSQHYATGLVHVSSATLTASHQRALSLPTASPMPNNNQNQNPNIVSNSNNNNNHIIQYLPQTSTANSNNNNNNNSSNNNNGKVYSIQPIHQRTRSLPLCEENAIIISQSPPLPLDINKLSTASAITENQIFKLNNNSMESIIEDQNSTDSLNNNNSNNNSILKQLSKIANNSHLVHKYSNTDNNNCSSSSPLLLRKKRHHNVLSASLRSTTSIGRDRCDSLPSTTRSRTSSESNSNQHPAQSMNINNNNNNNNNMPPPKSVPSMSVRPHSMYTPKFVSSQSPPVQSSPMSPPYSTESDGSSISIDEPDGFSHPLTPDDIGFPATYHNPRNNAIPEENDFVCGKNSEDYANTMSLPLPYIQNAIRKGSPAVNPDVYMEMCPLSSCSSSPGDPSNSYMPMSPGVDYRGGICTSSSHSRASSLAEEVDGYVSMHPSHHSDGGLVIQQPRAEDYMDMGHGNQSLPGDASSVSSSSIMSGTPSTDMRFSEYHLDKVVARFTPSEDDDTLDRPLRTYSVGSKLEHNKRKQHYIERVAAEHCRTRAFSVGSRKVTRAELTKTTPTASSVAQQSSSYVNHEINNNAKVGKKSSSAPLLNNTTNRTHGSFNMDDLMEIDFSNRSDENINNQSTPMKSTSHPVPVPKQKYDDYMNMSGRGSSGRTMLNTVPGYVEMKPGPGLMPESHRNITAITDNKNDYLDMKPAGPSSNHSLSSFTSGSPVKVISTPKTVPLTSNSLKSNTNYNNNYMDMSPRSYEGSSQNRMATSSSSLSSIKAPSDDYLNMSPVNKSLLDVEVPKRSSVPDGYMEMSWNNANKSKNQHKHNNFEQPSSSSDEYINMDYSNNNELVKASNGKSISLPITIQNNNKGGFNRNPKNQATVGNPTANKPSSIDAPPGFLPISCNSHNMASVSPTRARCDSGFMTPSSGSATIFPFSPGSPMKQFDPLDDSNIPRKCLVDASSGTVQLTEDDIDEEPKTPVPQITDPSKILNTEFAITKTHEKQLDTLSDDYAVMNLGEPASKKPNLNLNMPVMGPMSGQTRTNRTQQQQQQQQQQKTQSEIQILQQQLVPQQSHVSMSPDLDHEQQHDYVNYLPAVVSATVTKVVTPKPVASCSQQQKRACVNNDPSGDYAIMNPFKKIVSPVVPIEPATVTLQPPTTKKSVLLTVSSQEKLNNVGFKPIVEDEPQPVHQSLSRQVSEKKTLSSDNSGYEILRPLSRPNSVNSEKISFKSNGNTVALSSNRPSSANSDRMISVSSTSSSTSTLCDFRSQSSSSNTIRLVEASGGNPSPMNITSRPESVTSDVHMCSRPPSVTSSDREIHLHYASLDLPPNTNSNGSAATVPSAGVQRMEVDEPKTDQSTPSPNTASSSSSSSSQQQAFTYAQIDFIKSESLKNVNQQQQSHQSNNNILNNNSNNNNSGNKKQ